MHELLIEIAAPGMVVITNAAGIEWVVMFDGVNITKFRNDAANITYVGCTKLGLGHTNVHDVR